MLRTLLALDVFHGAWKYASRRGIWEIQTGHSGSILLRPGWFSPGSILLRRIQLGDINEQNRKVVAETLAQLGESRWRQWVKGDKEDYSRLGCSGDLRALALLHTALTDTDWAVRKLVVDALGQSHDPNAIEPLIHLLIDKNEGGRKAAALALNALGAPQWAQWIKGNKDDYDRLGQSTIR